ncbi:MAG: carboxypeptidase-like regulatory domain-containing protein [Pyrinomonadaceae bacterium]
MPLLSRYIVVFAVCTLLLVAGASRINGQDNLLKFERNKMSGDRSGSVSIIAKGGSEIIDRPFGNEPCPAANIGYNQAIHSIMSISDCPIGSGRYAEIFVFEGLAGQQISIRVQSTEMDPYIGLFSVDDESFQIEDDNGGGGANSLIETTLPADGYYIIAVTTVRGLPYGGYDITLDKTPRCTYTVSPATLQIPALGGNLDVSVTTDVGCYWTAVSNSRPHVGLINDGSMVNYDGIIRHYGHGTFTLTADLNDPGSTFTGSLTVAGQTIPLTQLALACTYALSQNSVSVSGAPQTLQLDVITQEGCPWTQINNNGWHNATNVSAGGLIRGPKSLSYFINNNSSAVTRVGTATIADLTFTITQAGLACTYSVPVNNIQVPAENPTGTFRVETQEFCTFGFNSGPTGYLVQFLVPVQYGPRDVTYVFQRNIEARPRVVNARLLAIEGTVSIPITLTQAGAASFPKTISGRVVSPTGMPLRNVVVTLTDDVGNKRYATTSSFGLYSFDAMTGYYYLLSAASKRYRFSTQGVFLQTDTGPTDMQALE